MTKNDANQTDEETVRKAHAAFLKCHRKVHHDGPLREYCYETFVNAIKHIENGEDFPLIVAVARSWLIPFN
jgi:hypothetical protein